MLLKLKNCLTEYLIFKYYYIYNYYNSLQFKDL